MLLGVFKQFKCQNTHTVKNSSLLFYFIPNHYPNFIVIVYSTYCARVVGVVLVVVVVVVLRLSPYSES